MIKIIPAILAKSFEEFEDMVRKVEPYVDLVHFDIADGSFVTNKTIDGWSELAKINTKLDFEVHLMVNNPETVIDSWFNTKVKRFLVHSGAVSDFDFLINKINIAGREVGCVFNPKIDYSAVERYIDRFNLFQFMTVDPGYYGAPFLPEVLDKIRRFHTRYPGKSIQVDGGMRPDTIKLAADAGANSAVSGSYIFSKDKDAGKTIKELIEAV
jgi:ribulose-phosphate 3-epimerase